MDPETATIIGAIIGAVLTGPVTFCLSRSLSRRQEFNKAAAIFREAFLEERIKLAKVITDVHKIINEETIIQHEKARIIFEPYLSKQCQNYLGKDWEEYKKFANLETQEVAPGSFDVRKREAKRALDLIEKVLRCARPK